MTRRITGWAVLLTAAWLCGCSGMQPRVAEDYQFTTAWNAYERIVIQTRNGDVRVVVDETHQDVDLRGRKSVGGATIEDAQANVKRVSVAASPAPDNARTLLVELQWPDDLDRFGPAASVNLRVPATCAVEADTSNGDIVIARAGPGSKLDTSNGEIEVDFAAGDAELMSTNGGLRVDRCEGKLTGRTSNGSIRVGHVAGAAELHTSNSSIHASDVLGPLTATTSNGRIEVTARPAAGAAVRLVSSNGSIQATVPRSLSGLVDLKTSNGTVQVVGEPMMKIRQTSKSHLVGVMNEGAEGGLDADTSNGSITVVFD